MTAAGRFVPQAATWYACGSDTPIQIADLKSAHEVWFPVYMAG